MSNEGITFGGGCPFGRGAAPRRDNEPQLEKSASQSESLDESESGSESGQTQAHADRPSLTYTTYLKVDELLSLQQLEGRDMDGKRVHDEHLFIIVHQAYELWFNQVLWEIDSVRELFSTVKLDESKLLTMTSRLQRCVLILRLLVDQFAILETMSALDFMEFRGALEKASGFQSWQFRLLETKLGLLESQRIAYSKQTYMEALEPKHRQLIADAAKEPSLSALVQRWLERTPGLEPDGFNFWAKYKWCVERYIDYEYKRPVETATDPQFKQQKTDEYEKTKETFHNVFDEESFQELVERGEHSFSYTAFQGAMMISLYRHEPRFHQPYQLLTLLMDIDALLVKWRFFHVSMVQRMIGSKMGTGGSSGYQYLRATVSDRYKVFLDLNNLTTYLIPRAFTPPLSRDMEHRLSVCMRTGADPFAAPAPAAGAPAAGQKSGHNGADTM